MFAFLNATMRSEYGFEAALYYPDGGRRVRETAKAAGDPLLPLTEWVISRPSIRTIDSVEQLWEVNILAAQRDDV